MKVLLVLVLLVAITAAAKYEPKKYDSSEHGDGYEFEWSVNDEDSGVDMSHKEARDKDQTKGVYKVLLPNGVVQTVTYFVDDDKGYVAKVENEEAESDESGED